jgi:hypothetical protein
MRCWRRACSAGLDVGVLDHLSKLVVDSAVSSVEAPIALVELRGQRPDRASIGGDAIPVATQVRASAISRAYPGQPVE